MSRVERKRRARTEALLDTAMALVGEDGLDAFSLHKLAEAADLTVGAIYRYFPSKSALIAALERRVIEALGETLQATTVEVTLRGDEWSENTLLLLIELASAYRDRFRSHPEQMRLIGGLLTTPDSVLRPNEADDVMSAMFDALSHVQEALDKAAHRGDIRRGPSLERAILVWASLRGVVLASKLQRHRPDVFAPDQLFKGLVNSLLLGWGADEERVRLAWDLIEEHGERR